MSSSRKPVRMVTAGDMEFQKRLSEFDSLRDPEVQAALDPLKAADVCFMNCEMGLARSGYRAEKPYNLHSDPALAHDLVDLGIHVVTVANNHTMDYGYDGMFETLRNLDSAGVARVGAGRDLAEALRPHYMDVGGERFAFLGVASTLPPGSAADPARPGVAPIRVSVSFEPAPGRLYESPGAAPVVHTQAVARDVERVTEAIAAARKEADHVIVGVHWGLTRLHATPLQGQIAEYQPPLGRAFIDAGADMVVGNHSHNLLGIEVYRGRPIFYSLGNFAFTPIAPEMFEPESVLVLADFAGSSLRVRLAPITLNAEGLPIVPDSGERARILELARARSARFGTRFLLDQDRAEVLFGE